MRLKDELRKELEGNLETYKKLIDNTTTYYNCIRNPGNYKP